MNFREWLKIYEDARPSQGVRHGPDSMYGGPRTMLPISWGMDNRAVGSIVGGIGDARAKIRSQMGAEPGSVPHLNNLEDIRRSALKAIYMPLQLLPEDWDSEGSRRSGRSMINQARQISPNPLKDDRIYNVIGGEQGVQTYIDTDALKMEPEQMKTRLYTFKKETRNPNREETATNFTTALMQASLSSMDMFGKYSHLLDVDKAHLKDRKMFPMPINPEKYRTADDPEGSVGDAEFYMVMMCSFEISPKNKNSHISGDVWDEIEAMRDADRNKKPETTKSDAETAKPEATPPTK